MEKNQRGFAPALIIISIAIVLILGFIAFTFVSRSFKDQGKQSSGISQQPGAFVSESFCKSQEWPPDCAMIPFQQGVEMCRKCQGLSAEAAPATLTDKFIVVNPVDLLQIKRISKFRSCAGHDYSGLNSQGVKETVRSMKHYLDPMPILEQSTGKVKAIAPFDSVIAEVGDSGGIGNNVFFSPSGQRSGGWQFIFFHIDLKPGLKKDSSVKAGEVVGYASLKGGSKFDMGLKKFGREGQIFDSPFFHMSDEVLNQYSAKSVTTENVIISKEVRDASPCKDTGGRADAGEVRFSGERREDWVVVQN